MVFERRFDFEKEAMIAALKIPPIKTDLRKVDSKLVAQFHEDSVRFCHSKIN